MSRDRQPTAPPRQAVVLAGGLATRMRPRTDALPKLLLPVAGRPFAAWLLERLAQSGYDEVVLCIGHLGDRVRQVVGDGASFGIPVRYSEEGASLLGTAGALRRALPLLEPTFLVTYGDSYLPFDYSTPLADLRAHPEALGTMAVHHNRDRWERSNAAVDGDLVIRYQKGGDGLDHIDYGATALRRDVIAELPEQTVIGLDELQARLSRERRLRALRVAERFYEIGSEAGLAELEALLAGGARAEARAR